VLTLYLVYVYENLDSCSGFSSIFLGSGILDSLSTEHKEMLALCQNGHFVKVDLSSLVLGPGVLPCWNMLELCLGALNL